MADEVSSEVPDTSVDPNVLIDRKFLHFALFECSEDLIEPLIGILRKYLGAGPMTEEEHAIATIFAEEAILVTAEDVEGDLES
tara:strand:+ start:11770 stop:12018 length:249 start_codon:yes stop_codon:yes gene_type:complete